MVRGIFTLLQATAVTDRWGTTSYARLNATLTLTMMASAAFAPWCATALAAGLGSHAAALVVFAVVAAASLAVIPALDARTTEPAANDARTT